MNGPHLRTCVCLCAALLAFASGARGQGSQMVGKKMIRIGSETNSQMFVTTLDGAASWTDAFVQGILPGKFAAWQNTGFDGLSISIASNQPQLGFTNMGAQWWNVDVVRIYSEFIGEISVLNSQNWGRLTDNFLHTSMSPWDTPGTVQNQDWFNDNHWAKLVSNTALSARVASDLGFKGILLDTEQYDHHGGQPWYHPFDYQAYAAGGCSCPPGTEKTFAEASAKVFQRGQEYAQALNSEFPGITLMMIPAIYRPPSGNVLPSETLYQPFFDGILSGLDANSKILGGSEFTYDESDFEDFADVRDATIAQYLARSNFDQDLMDKWSFAPGVFADHPGGGTWSTTDVNLNFRDPAEHEYAMRNALAAADEYAWSYGEQSQFLEETPTPLIQQYLQAHENAHDPIPFGGDLDETYDGNFFHDGRSSFTSSGGGIGTEILFQGSAVQVNNIIGLDGTYRAAVPISADSVYEVSVDVRIKSGAVTGNARVLTSLAGDEQTDVDINIEAVQNPDGDNTTSTWDLLIEHGNGTTLLGLTLPRNVYHTIAARHLNNAADEIEVFVNGVPVGRYPDRKPLIDLGLVSAGNPSSVIGFGSANLDNFMVTLLTLLGDANNDLVVTADDLIAVQQNFGATGPADGSLLGDANDDGAVTADDLIAVQQNFGAALGGIEAAAVPEPGSAGALAIVGLALAAKRRRA